jgi:16S rRNA processing protein RimM
MAPVIVGRVGRVHGLRGEVMLEGCSLSADEMLALREFTWRGHDGKTVEVVMEEARAVLGRLLVRFSGIGDRDQALALSRGQLVVEAERLPDPGPGLTYAFRLVGLQVETEEGRVLGTLQSILPTGANPVYVVRGARELLVPATEQVLRRVDFERGVITVALPAGLEDL